jgi:3-oxoacyl-[acyl-carrier protein] reductase
MTTLVTGSSRGIGKAAALKFASLGHNVVINCSRGGREMDETLREAELINKNVMAVAADVSDYDEVSSMFRRVSERFGGTDILINNAGVSLVGLFSDTRPEEWDRVMSANVKSVFNCAHIAAGYMVKRKNGVIINISSVWGVSGASCEAVYSASKGAVSSFTKALGRELAPSGVRVNAVACGVIDTGMNDFLDAEEKAELEARIPASRFGKPGEVAELCAFLASDSAKYINGQTIILDGGFI